jgi:DNA-binding NarL/FixJ family response regulator
MISATFGSGERGKFQQTIMCPLHKATVLVADDHSLVRARVASYLQAAFEVVGTVENGRDLVTEAQRLKPEVIVTDITMPILDGIGAVRRLREHGLPSKVVFLTVHTDRDFVEACLAAGACGYVIKSRMGTDLVTAVVEALTDHRFVSPNLQ